jgi:hypothetical protein
MDDMIADIIEVIVFSLVRHRCPAFFVAASSKDGE